MKKLLFTLFVCSQFLGFSQIVTIPDANFKNALLNHNPVIDTNGDGEIQVTEAESITDTIDVSQRSIIQMTGIEAFINIRYLICEYNDIEEINISNILGLWVLDIVGNNITSLNLSNNLVLHELYFDWNSVNSLDITKNTQLSYLSCAYNELSEIDTSKNPILHDLWCPFNQITSIDVVSNKYYLSTLNCRDNNLTHLDVRNGINDEIVYFNSRNNPNLECIYVDDTEYSIENWTHVDPNSTFVETEAECNAITISELNLNTVDVYPNPFIDTLSIQTNLTDNLTISIYNTLGKKVLKTTNKHIDTQDLEKGVYVLKITSKNGKNLTKKVLKID